MHVQAYSEAEFTRQVLDLAGMHHWRRVHFRPARTKRGWRTAGSGDIVGFPDVLLLRGPALVVAELKVGKNQTTPEQDDWLLAWQWVGAATYVWHPEDWKLIEAVLGGQP